MLEPGSSCLRYPWGVPPPSLTPTIPAVLDQSDLETAVGVKRLVDLLFRSSSESATPSLFSDRVAEVCQRATDHAAGILLQAFDPSQIIVLFDSDYSVWCNVRDLGAGFAGLYQTELVDPETGIYPFSMQWKIANQALKDRVKGSPRAIGEIKAGNNKNVTTRQKRIPCRSTFTGRRAF